MIATSIASPVFPSLSPKTLALDVPKPTSVSLSLGFSPKPISVSASFLSSVNASSRPFIRRVAVLDLEQDQEVLSETGQPSFWLEQQFLSLPYYTTDLAQLAGVFEGAFDVQTAEERNGRALRVNCGPSPPKSDDSSSRRTRVARSKGGGHGRIRFRKQHRGRLKGVSHRGNRICFGRYALQALEPAWITTRQIEAGRRAMTRNIRRGGRIWVRIFPDKPVTVRPTDSRMGSGKGSPEFWVAVVKPGRIIYEMSGVTENVARIAMSIAASKMPIRTQFIVSG